MQGYLILEIPGETLWYTVSHLVSLRLHTPCVLPLGIVEAGTPQVMSKGLPDNHNAACADFHHDVPVMFKQLFSL